MGATREAIASRDPTDPPDAKPADAEMLIGAARGVLLGRLSAGMVHEARNPLNAIAIHLEVLADKLIDEESGTIPAHLARNMDAARAQVRRLDDLLRRYGEFAGGEAAQETDGLAACLSRAALLCEFHLRRGGLTVEVDAPEGVQLRQPDALSHAVLQLLLMAAGRAAPGSELVLSGRAEVDAIHVGLSGMGEESKSDDWNSMAVEAIRAIAETLGGELALEDGERWYWSLRLPSAFIAAAT
jgi:signal transduction histidine kinase